MAQFDVHVLPDSTWVVSVQSDLIADHRTVLVIPLILPDEDARPTPRLNPLLDIRGDRRILATHLMAAVRTRDLGPARASLIDDDFTIKAAIDVLINGF